MDVYSVTSLNATLILELNELLIIENTLAEVIDYLGDDEFHPRTGAYIYEGERLLSFIRQKIAIIENNAKTDAGAKSSIAVSISKDEFFLVKSVFNEIINGYKVVDFNNRIGTSEDDARILYGKIKDCIDRVRGTLT